MTVQTFYIPFGEELLPVKRLKAGNIDCVYENGSLRNLKCGETEILRMIYFAVRDENWDTATFKIENESLEENENGFEISYTSLHFLNDISYKAEVKITGENNSISFYMRGEALSSFKRNRIGLCLHHPIEECSGKDAMIKRPDSTIYKGTFPELIGQHQPFKDIREMECSFSDNLKLKLSFDGDEFETEDQRNWGDASYKTYSTPLDLSFPVQVTKGERIEQKITAIIIGGEITEKRITTISEKKIPFPGIGYGRKIGDRLTEDELALLSQLPFNHYRVEIFLFNQDWKQEFVNAIWEASNLKTKLELILVFNDEFKNQFAGFIKELETSSDIIDSILPLHAEHKTTPFVLFEFVAGEIRKKGLHIKTGYGTNGFFAELNRNRPTGIAPDFISFGLNPQVHATDTRSIIENIERQADLVKTAKDFAPNAKIYISPITFYKWAKTVDGRNEAHPPTDTRLHQSLGALWTLHTIKNLSSADGLSFYQTTGIRGILNQTAQQSPLYHVLKTLKTFGPECIIIDDIHKKLISEEIVLENNKGDRLEFIIDSTRIFEYNNI